MKRLLPILLLLLAVPVGAQTQHGRITQQIGVGTSTFDMLTAGKVNNIVYVDGTKYATIQSALSALPTADANGDNGGGKVYIPRGTYTLSSTLNVSNHGLVISGTGFATVLKANASFTGSDLVFVDPGATWLFLRDITIENLTLDCNGVAGLNALHVQDVQNEIHLKNVWIRNCKGRDLYFTISQQLDNEGILIENVFSVPHVAKTQAGWELNDVNEFQIIGGKAFGNDGIGGANAGPGLLCKGCRGGVIAGFSAATWGTGIRFTNSTARASLDDSLVTPTLEALTTALDITGTAGLKSGRIRVNWPRYVGAITTGINLDFASDCSIKAGSEEPITLSANADLTHIETSDGGGAAITDNGTNTVIVSHGIGGRVNVKSVNGIQFANGTRLYDQSTRGVMILANSKLDLFDSSGATILAEVATDATRVKRLKATQATALVSGDFSLSGGWGRSPSIGSIAGTDQGFVATVTSGTGTPTANPTITLTFHDGTWTNSPVAVCGMKSGGSGTVQQLLVAPTATTLVITYNGTPGTSQTFPISCVLMGR